MADLKISALTASTTPLAGTEVLPIVQSGTTKQVSVANLTAGRALAASTLALNGTLPADSKFYVVASTGNMKSRYDASSGTGSCHHVFVNTTVSTIGTESSTGGTLVASSSPYATVIANNSAYPVQVGVSNAVTWEFTTSGNLQVKTSGKGIAGTTTNDSANAGVVGEFISSAVGGLVALTTGTSQNATSISLTAGDWDVTGCIGFVPASTTSITALKGTIGTTSALYNDNAQYSFSDYYSAVVPGGSTTFYKTLPVQRISLASTTTVYLVAQATFGVAALYTGSCFIRARRVR